MSVVAALGAIALTGIFAWRAAVHIAAVGTLIDKHDEVHQSASRSVTVSGIGYLLLAIGFAFAAGALFFHS